MASDDSKAHAARSQRAPKALGPALSRAVGAARKVRYVTVLTSVDLEETSVYLEESTDLALPKIERYQ